MGLLRINRENIDELSGTAEALTLANGSGGLG